MKTTIDAMNEETQNQISAVMLQHGTPAQREEALWHCSQPKREEAQTVEPVAYRYKFAEDLQWQTTTNGLVTEMENTVVEPLFTHPAPQPSGGPSLAVERAALIERLRELASPGHGLYTQAADMLAADAQEIVGWRTDQKENLANQCELQKQINDLKAQQGCARSHPHENMSKMCELRTELARANNQLAQQVAVPQEQKDSS